MAKYSQFNNRLKFLFFNFSLPLTYRKRNINSKIKGHLKDQRISKDPLVSLVLPSLKSDHSEQHPLLRLLKQN